jgi:L-lactate dehydrogenase complex protein LldG
MTATVEEFIRNATAAGFTVLRDELPDREDAGVSIAAYGVAATGSVVLLASPAEPRARSLLPVAHVSVLDEDRILPGLPELFAALGSDLPSAVSIVSGPSTSGDIEQRHMVGIHAPGEVYVVLRSGQGPEPEARDGR